MSIPRWKCQKKVVMESVKVLMFAWLFSISGDCDSLTGTPNGAGETRNPHNRYGAGRGLNWAGAVCRRALFASKKFRGFAGQARPWSRVLWAPRSPIPAAPKEALGTPSQFFLWPYSLANVHRAFMMALPKSLCPGPYQIPHGHPGRPKSQSSHSSNREL